MCMSKQFDRQVYNIKVLYSHVYHGMQHHTILYAMLSDVMSSIYYVMFIDI